MKLLESAIHISQQIFPRHTMSLRTEIQSSETDTILNTVDELRSLGIGHILELPQIIVCGDQSSGKRLVLSAVSTFKFLTKDGLQDIRVVRWSKTKMC